ncbi:MAG TPA: DUF378 domain-containing protein [Candidatus Paceibacterota bacterium]
MKNTCEICKEGECKECGACGCHSHWHVLKRVTLIILVIGGINWSLYGLWNFNLVEFLFGYGFLAKVVYGLFGVAAVYKLIIHLIKWCGWKNKENKK